MGGCPWFLTVSTWRPAWGKEAGDLAAKIREPAPEARQALQILLGTQVDE